MKILTCLLFLLITSFGYSQSLSGTEATDSTNIYCHALATFLKSYEPQDKNMVTVLVEKNDLTTNKCITKIGSYSIQYIDGFEVKQLLKKETSITLIRVIPLRVKQGDFFINIIPFSVQRKKKNYQYINSGGASVHYQFNTESKIFEMVEIKISGI